MDNVAATCEFARVSSRPAAGIENHRSRHNLPANEPGGDRSAFLLDRPVNEQIERPGVFSVERTTQGLIHLDGCLGDQRVDVGKIRNREALAPRLRRNRLEKNRTETGVLSTDDIPSVVIAHEERICGRHVK